MFARLPREPWKRALRCASGDGPPGSEVLAAARYQGNRLASIAGLIAAGERDVRLAA